MRKKEVVKDLKDLNPSDYPESGDNSLDVDLGEIAIPEVKEEEAQKVQAAAAGIASWMKTHLQKLDNLNAQPEAVQARPEIKKAIKAIWGKIYSFMNHSEAGYRQTAWLEFLLHKIESPATKTWIDLSELTEWLVKKQYLEENERGPLKTPWGPRFAIPKTASFGAIQFRQVEDAWNKMSKSISHETAQNRAERARQIKDNETDVSDIGLLEEKENGTALLYVPGQILIRNGEVDFFNPGLLLVRRDGDKLFPIEGVGSFDRKIDGINGRKTYVLSFTLAPDWTRPPSKKMLIEERGFKEAQTNDLCFAWYLLKRASQHLSMSNEVPPEELVKFGEQVSVPANEFLLERKNGVALIELDGSIVITGEDKTRTAIDKAFFLVERESRKFRLLKTSGNLQAMLDAESFNEEYAEGDQYEGLPSPLQMLLKMAYFEAYFKQMLE